MIIKHVTLHQNWRHKRDKKRGTSETKRESQARYRPQLEMLGRWNSSLPGLTSVFRLKVFGVQLFGTIGSYLFSISYHNISSEYVGNGIGDVMPCPLQWSWTTRKKTLPRLISETQSCRSVLHTSEVLKGKIVVPMFCIKNESINLNFKFS